MRGLRTRAVAVVGLVAALSGCASIMNGTRQAVGISSSPTAATVTADGVSQGRTPVVAQLARKDNHIVRIELEGYQPFEATLTRSVSGWVWGNIVFGGLIGLAVDAISGGLYKLTPEQVTATLGRTTARTHGEDGALSLAVVLEPDPGWQRIGSLLTPGRLVAGGARRDRAPPATVSARHPGHRPRQPPRHAPVKDVPAADHGSPSSGAPR